MLFVGIFKSRGLTHVQEHHWEMHYWHLTSEDSTFEWQEEKEEFWQWLVWLQEKMSHCSHNQIAGESLWLRFTFQQIKPSKLSVGINKGYIIAVTSVGQDRWRTPQICINEFRRIRIHSKRRGRRWNLPMQQWEQKSEPVLQSLDTSFIVSPLGWPNLECQVAKERSLLVFGKGPFAYISYFFLYHAKFLPSTHLF